jgi:pectinesterase
MKNLFQNVCNALLCVILFAVTINACKDGKELDSNDDTTGGKTPAELNITLNVDSLYVDVFQADKPEITGKVTSANNLQSIIYYIIDNYDALLPIDTITGFENTKEYDIKFNLNFNVVMKGFRVVATDEKKNVATKTIPLQVVDLLHWEPEVAILPAVDTVTLSIAVADTLPMTVRAQSSAGIASIKFFLVELRGGQQTESLAHEISFTPTPDKKESCTGTVTCTPHTTAVKVAVTNGKGHVKYVERPVRITDRNIVAPQIAIPSANDTIKASLSLASKATVRVEVFSAAGLSNIRYCEHKANGDSVELKSINVEGKFTFTDSYVFAVTAATVGFSVTAANSEGAVARSYKPAKLYNPFHIIVAKDGSGTHTTVKAAFAAIPNNSSSPTVVLIKNGTYREWLILESSKKNVILVGEHVDSAIITYDAAAPDPYPTDGSAPKGASGTTVGTMGSATLHVEAENFYAENLTIQNTAGINAGQAVALRTTKDKQVFVNCKLKGFQDTHYTHGDGRQYYKKCYIEGTVDFIFGNAAAYFDECVLYCLIRSNGGEVTAGATPAGKYGYIFNNCRIEGNAAAGTFSLGRPWKDNCHVVFMNTYMSRVIKAKGWSTWDTKTYKYYEYNNSGEGTGSPSVRGNNATDPGTFKYLTDDEAADYAVEKVMRQQPNAAQTVDNWHPNQLINSVESILR